VTGFDLVLFGGFVAAVLLTAVLLHGYTARRRG
jgi:hypothetical protein